MNSETIKTAIVYLVIAVFFGFVSYTLVSWVRHELPWRSYVVQSGSMEPSIMTGDLIIIQKQTTYAKNDVITFKDVNQRTVTHRIMEISKSQPVTVTTKGDANQTIDIDTITQEQIIGKVVQVLPKFGYVVRFIKSPWGFILTIITPAILIVYDEVKVIFSSNHKPRRRRILH